MKDVHAVPADSSGSHKASRQCKCGPTAMRDLATGYLTVWRHRTPPKPAEPLDPLQLAARRDLAKWEEQP